MNNFVSRIIFLIPMAFVFACQDDLPPINQQKETPFVPDELVVMYKVEASPDTIKQLEALIREAYPNATKTVCSSCNNLVDLWEASGIHNFVLDGHAEVTRVGNSRVTGHIDNGNIVFSPNFINSFPQDADFGNPSKDSLKISEETFNSKQEVLIAILDSGVDLGLFPSRFLWNISNDNSSDNCYEEEKEGWNTISHNGNIHDDTEIKHGTFVNAYILEQFMLAENNVPELLLSKTFTFNNLGTLFFASINCSRI